MKVIARIYNDFSGKFALPRQSGLVEHTSVIVFEKEYRVKEAVRGLEEFSHIWLLWNFSESERESWSPTIRPPKLGGNTRMGVFATRSPFRPNPIGLSSVKLLKVDFEGADAPKLYVSGADLMNGTPIYDIKPYLAYTDSHPEATSGFALDKKEGELQVIFPKKLKENFSKEQCETLIQALAQNPRPAYQDDGRVYGFSFAEKEVKFSIENGVATILEII